MTSAHGLLRMSLELIYSIGAMTWGSVELESEIRDWLEGMSPGQFAHAAFYVDLLADYGPLLG